eukprot:363203-Chlamydomonas_euryale.AAC.19
MPEAANSGRHLPLNGRYGVHAHQMQSLWRLDLCFHPLLSPAINDNAFQAGCRGRGVRRQEKASVAPLIHAHHGPFTTRTTDPRRNQLSPSFGCTSSLYILAGRRARQDECPRRLAPVAGRSARMGGNTVPEAHWQAACPLTRQ